MKRAVKKYEHDAETMILDREASKPEVVIAVFRQVCGSPVVDGLGAVVILASLGLLDTEVALDYEALAERPATGPQDGSEGIPSTGCLPVTTR